MASPEQLAAMASSMGLEMPSPWYIFGAIVFSIIGYGIYRFGKREANLYVRVLGIVLMLFTYVVSSPFYVFLIGGLLCVAAWCAHITQDSDD